MQSGLDLLFDELPFRDQLLGRKLGCHAFQNLLHRRIEDTLFVVQADLLVDLVHFFGEQMVV